MSNLLKTILGISFLFTLPIASAAQAKVRKPAAKKPVKVVKKTPSPTPEAEAATVPKKNERPDDVSAAPADGAAKTNKRGDAPAKTQTADKTAVPAYFYNFTQPEFIISSVTIEHDETGKGRISFVKKDVDDPIVDPVLVSPTALERINGALQALKFWDSNEIYQYEKDYSHLGNIKIRVKKDGRERSTAFNWTQNKDAKALADEYRKISNQAIWIFDITLARQNQPLETPKLLDTLDAYIRRGEISDTEQMLSFVQGLSNDERLPLIARNHATRIVKEIEKQAKKK